jgi:hypothetical protein
LLLLLLLKRPTHRDELCQFPAHAVRWASRVWGHVPAPPHAEVRARPLRLPVVHRAPSCMQSIRPPPRVGF